MYGLTHRIANDTSADRDVVEHPGCDLHKVLDRQVVQLLGGHRLSRASSSLSSARTRSIAALNRCGRSETY